MGHNDTKFGTKETNKGGDFNQVGLHSVCNLGSSNYR